jgi:hypothetical protein
MKNSDTRVLKAYMKMIYEGTAFENWGQMPDQIFRKKIVEGILKDTGITYSDCEKLNKLKRAVGHIKTDDKRALEKAINDFMISEEEFKV